MDAIRQQLQSRLETLLTHDAKLEAHLRAPLDADSGEQAQSLEGDEVVERLSDAARAEIAQLRAAITRMDAGTYGLCESCGEPIAAGRLAAIPFATRCVRCA